MGVVLLVRHGQASFGADDYDVLSATGWEQGRALGRWLAARGERPVSVVRGGMRRHRETWAAIADGAGWAGGEGGEQGGEGGEDGEGVAIEPAWDEFDATGVFAGHPWSDDATVRREFEAYFEASLEAWTAGTAEEGLFTETWLDFCTRVATGLERATRAPGPVVVVTSGGPVSAVAASLLHPDEVTARASAWSRLSTVVANTSVTRVVVGASGVRLLTFNEHGHLDRDLVTYR